MRAAPMSPSIGQNYADALGREIVVVIGGNEDALEFP